MSESRIIVYVDDDEDDRDLFSEVIRTVRPDLEVVLAKDGHDALEKLGILSTPACVFIDMNMPKMSGLQLLGVLKSDPRLSPIPAVILTTALTPHQRVELIGLGAKDYLIKPSSFEDFKNMLKSNLLKLFAG
ncbi:MAG TPA: response regulator [Chryseosolibacter sp.]